MAGGKITRVVTDRFDFDMSDSKYQFAINSDNKSYDANVVTLSDTGEKINLEPMTIKSRSISVSGLVIGKDRTDALNIASDIKTKWYGEKATIYDDSGKTLYGYFSNVNHGFYRGQYDGRIASLNSTFVPLDPQWRGADKVINQEVTGATNIQIINTGNVDTYFSLDIECLANGTLSKDFLSDYFTFSQDIQLTTGNVLSIDPHANKCYNGSTNIIQSVSDSFFLEPFVLGVSGFELKIKNPGISINVEINYKERFA